MSKLVCVEYNAPVPGRGSNNTQTATPPLSGFIGETLDSFLQEHKRGTLVPVRFPLLGPGSSVSLLGKDRVVDDPYQLSLEGEMLDPKYLYVLERKTPVSLYTRVPLGDVESLFESSTYMSTYSLDKLFQLLKEFDSKYKHRWVWKAEHPQTGAVESKYRHIFLEAKVYGIDAAINTYNGNRFGGVAIEVTYKPQPSKEMLKQGIMVMRTCTDLLLFSDSEEYISYVDGVQVRRESVVRGWATARYSEFISPKEATALGRFKEYTKKIETTKKDVAMPTSGILKDTPPPTKATTRWSQPTVTGNSLTWITTTTTTGAK